MILIIVISTRDFQMHWNVLSLSFSERESGKWPLGRSEFYHNYVFSNDYIQHSGKISICNTQLKQFLESCLLTARQHGSHNSHINKRSSNALECTVIVVQ